MELVESLVVGLAGSSVARDFIVSKCKLGQCDVSPELGL